MKVWIPQVTKDYVHWQALKHIAYSMAAKYNLEYCFDYDMPEGDLLIVGHHLMRDHITVTGRLPTKNSVLLNTEYEVPKPVYGLQWLDIMPENEGKLGDLEPLYPYTPPEAEAIECDIMFSGCLNDRRIKILKQLIDAGLDVKIFTDNYNNDAYRYGAKVILDCHFYAFEGRFNIARILSYMVYNKPIVTESRGGYYNDILTGGYIQCGYHELVDNCIELIESQDKRQKLITDIKPSLDRLAKESNKIRNIK